MPAASPADRRYCREVLPRVSRTFALNIRLLRGPLGDSVRVAYLLCRAADALEDSWPGESTAVAERFEAFVAALEGDGSAASTLSATAAGRAGGRDDLGLLARLPTLLRVFEALPASHRPAVRDGVTTLARGMARYATRAAARGAHVSYLETEEELDDYCWIVAGCVGVMLTHLYAAEYGSGDAEIAHRRLELAPLVGRALQLTNILLDWPSDVRQGRCYVPAAWLAVEGIEPTDLVDRDRAEVRRLAERLESKARAALARVPDYIDLIPPRRVRYRLFCLWPALWALGSLRHARRDPQFPWGPRRPRLPRSELLRSSLLSLLWSHDGVALRRLWAASG